MLRTAIKVGILLLFVHAMYRFVPVYINYQQFNDAVKETALFAGEKSEQVLADRVMQLAERHKIPLDRESVRVVKEDRRIFISATYVEQIEWLPTYKRPYTFDVETDALTSVR